MDRAFEAVERMGLASRHDLKGFVVVIAARVAFSHGELIFERLSIAAKIIFSGRSRSVRWRANGISIGPQGPTSARNPPRSAATVAFVPRARGFFGATGSRGIRFDPALADGGVVRGFLTNGF